MTRTPPRHDEPAASGAGADGSPAEGAEGWTIEVTSGSVVGAASSYLFETQDTVRPSPPAENLRLKVDMAEISGL